MSRDDRRDRTRVSGRARGWAFCATCGDDLSLERIHQGEVLDCDHCREMSSAEHRARVYHVDRGGRWFRVG